ncbi:MAG: ABC transporter ATP-binding protein [Alphaproteobacteria bacterium]|nr:ABC transporter ATP-binding protein [Alphaproteobacteria bacterium]
MLKLRDNFRFIRQCLGMMAQERRLFLLLIVFSMLMALSEGMTISLLIPVLEAQGSNNAFKTLPLLGKISDLFSDYGQAEKLKIAAMVLGAVIFCRGMIQYIVTVISAVLPFRLGNQMILNNYDYIMAAELGFVNSKNSGELLNCISDLPQRSIAVLQNMADITWNFMVLVLYLAMMVIVSPQMSALAFVFMFLMSVILKKVTTGPIYVAGHAETQVRNDLGKIMVESLSGLSLIRLLVAENRMSAVFGHALDRYLSAQYKAALYTMMPGPFISISAGLFICFLLFASVTIHDGNPDEWIGMILLFLFVMMRLLSPVTAINTSRTRIAKHMHAFDAVRAFQDEARKYRQSDGDLTFTGLENKIQLQGIEFAYPRTVAKALHKFSLTVEKGRMVAIVGPSGAGKSTVVALLSRLYDPQSGKVLIDGVNLLNYRVGSWRKKIGIVSQDIFIFNDTVANNIRFAREDATMDEIRAAAKLAVASEFIDNLPDGYNTMLGERGARLSGGQRQRIAIARAVLADPDLLVLDEATSHLDSVTEQAIQQAMGSLRKDKTILVIAHRLSTIRSADQIAVMRDGTVVEQGTHDELVEQNGTYKYLLDHQELDLVSEPGGPLTGKVG